MNSSEALQHFHVDPTPELLHFTNEVALGDSRYLFVQRVKKNLYKMHCTHCNTDSLVEGAFAHNQASTCPKCGTNATIKQAGRGRKALVDIGYVEFAERSLIDPEAITIARYHATRDYREDYRNVTTTFHCLAMYIFKQGESHMFSRTLWNDEFAERRTVHSLDFSTSWFQPVHTYASTEQLHRIIQGTPFQYSSVETYEGKEVIPYLALYCKYPYVEALTKIGLENVISVRLNGHATQSINWRGKTLDKIIGLPKRDWKHFRLLQNAITQDQLILFKTMRELDQSTPTSELLMVSQSLRMYARRFIDAIQLTTTTFQKALNYLKVQVANNPEHYNSLRDVLVTWSDYVQECAETNVDLLVTKNLYPRDLYELHQKQIELKKIATDRENNLKVRERYEELASISFEDSGLLIRPFTSAQEIIDEGNQLKHCIGGYIAKHISGSIDLFTIRLVEKPDEHYYSVEIKDEDIIQVRGFDNKSTTEELNKFMDKYKSEILAQRKIILSKAS